METYRINEVMYTVQGEGARVGIPSVFVRCSGCNLRCSADDHNGPENNVGFSCDTEFASGRPMTLAEIERAVLFAQCAAFDAPPARDTGLDLITLKGCLKRPCYWLVLTGGEPALQVDREFCDFFHERGYKLAIETNGTKELPQKEDGYATGWSNDQLRRNVDAGVDDALEKWVGSYLLDWITVSPKSAEHTIRQPVAHEVKYVRNADHSIPVPSCKAIHHVLSPAWGSDGRPSAGAIARCVELALENPVWRVSLQIHKLLRVR